MPRFSQLGPFALWLFVLIPTFVSNAVGQEVPEHASAWVKDVPFPQLDLHVMSGLSAVRAA